MSLIKWILETSSQNAINAHKCTLIVNVFSAKVLIEDTIFTSPTGEVTAILRGHPSHAKVKPLAGRAKTIPSFLSYFKTLSIGSALEIEPATSCCAVNALHSFRMIFFCPSTEWWYTKPGARKKLSTQTYLFILTTSAV